MNEKNVWILTFVYFDCQKKEATSPHFILTEKNVMILALVW